MFKSPQATSAENTESIFKKEGRLSVPDDAKIRGIKPSRASDFLCSPSQKNKDLPLFEHLPCVDDVKQTDLGDCYLLAVLISLINSPKYGPDFIMDIMHDNGDGTVTVKLFKFDVDESCNLNIKRIRPIYTRVKKGEVFLILTPRYGFKLLKMLTQGPDVIIMR